MTMLIQTDPVPLAVDESGVIRVGGTRVTLDTLVEKFQSGVTADDLTRRFPSVKPAHIHAVIAYYLEHQAEVEEYLHEQDLEAEQIQREYEARFNLTGLRERLLAQRAAQDS